MTISLRFRQLLMHALQFFVWLFVHNLMVLPIFAAYLWLPQRGPLIQAVLALACAFLGGATIWLLNRTYEHALDKNHSLAVRHKTSLWQWVVTLIVTILWIGLQYYWPGSASADQSATESLFGSYPVPMFIVVSLLGPVYEELLSRGLFFAYFVHTDTWQARAGGLLTSTLLFGLLHSTTLSWATGGYLISGLVLGGLYLLTRNIRFSIMAHLISNIVAALS